MPIVVTVAGMGPTFTGPNMATGDSLAKKSLGQHWLSDSESLSAIVKMADLKKEDRVIEIGPGTGHLTKLLANKAKEVVAVELDQDLVDQLEKLNIANLKVINQDILTFNFSQFDNYKIVANIPYYLTGKIIRLISELKNRPQVVVLLVQKEIADRLSAKPGDLSVLGLTAQYYWQIEKGLIVKSEKFDPPPKVDSQIVKLIPVDHQESPEQLQALFRLIKIGFSAKRKTILNNLSSGYRITKEQTKTILASASIEPSTRAQNLSLTDWQRLADLISKKILDEHK